MDPDSDPEHWVSAAHPPQLFERFGSEIFFYEEIVSKSRRASRIGVLDMSSLPIPF